MTIRTIARAAVAAVVLAAGIGFSAPASAQTDRDGQQRWINITNNGNVTIREFYMTDVDTQGWGDDRLGDRVVESGQTVRVVPTQRQRARGYCQFDMRIVFANDRTWERRGVNLCQASELMCTASACSVR